MRTIAGWYRRLRGDGPLAPIGLAIGGMLALAVAIAAAVTLAGLRFLHFHGTKSEPLSAAALYDLLKIAFAVAAGIGGVVALVTAYRRQRVAEFAQDLARQQHELAGRAEEREATRLLNERFTTAAGQLGDDKPAVQLAGVYAMAGLADDWPRQRQTCVDVLCAYLRMPYEPDPGPDAPAAEQQAFRRLREVRHTVIRVIAAHLHQDEYRAITVQDWRGLNLDFTDAVFDGGQFNDADFTGGTVNFFNTRFTGGTVYFNNARFAGGAVFFGDTEFAGGTVSFDGAEFTGSTVHFHSARFTGGTVSFFNARFTDGTVGFGYAEFTGSTVSFQLARFTGSKVDFHTARFAGGTVDFSRAFFTGGTVNLGRAFFAGGTVNFGDASDWVVPPRLPHWETPPPGVTLSGDGSDSR